MVGLQDEATIFESPNTKEDPVGLFFPGKPVQLRVDGSFAEELTRTLILVTM